MGLGGTDLANTMSEKHCMGNDFVWVLDVDGEVGTPGWEIMFCLGRGKFGGVGQSGVMGGRVVIRLQILNNECCQAHAP